MSESVTIGDPSMRTPGGEVVRGRWGRSLSDGSMSGARLVKRVAALRVGNSLTWEFARRCEQVCALIQARGAGLRLALVRT
jgi:hypothetical protein